MGSAVLWGMILDFWNPKNDAGLDSGDRKYSTPVKCGNGGYIYEEFNG